MSISFLGTYMIIAGAVFFGVFRNSKAYGSANDGFRYTMGVMSVATFVAFVIMAYPFPSGGISGDTASMIIASTISTLAWLSAWLIGVNSSVNAASTRVKSRHN